MEFGRAAKLYSPRNCIKETNILYYRQTHHTQFYQFSQEIENKRLFTLIPLSFFNKFVSSEKAASQIAQKKAHI